MKSYNLLSKCCKYFFRLVRTFASMISQMHTPFNTIVFSILIFASSCKQKREDTPLKPVEAITETAVAPKPALSITYHFLTENIRKLDSAFTPEQAGIILALNRIDRKALRRKDSLIVPDTFLPLAAYSPFPEYLPELDSVKKIILFSYPLQAFAAYANGRQLRWGPTSLGKKSTPTLTGLFYTNWRAKRTVSTVDDEWILNWYFNIDNKGGVSIHQYELPGYPASHACARLSEEDAQWIYNWADQWKLNDRRQVVLAYGTPVIVFGSYQFGKKLMHQLLEGNRAILADADSIKSAVRPHLSLMLERQRAASVTSLQ
jgi:hypothetical protein